jgi:hypothetical protein
MLGEKYIDRNLDGGINIYIFPYPPPYASHYGKPLYSAVPAPEEYLKGRI